MESLSQLIRSANELGTIALIEAYKAFEFLPWLFEHAIPTIWQDQNLQSDYLNWHFIQHSIERYAQAYVFDWNAPATSPALVFARSHQNSPFVMTSTYFPAFQWLPWQFLQSSSVSLL